MHCIHNGHKVIALGNLHPPIQEHTQNSGKIQSDELDSFMYQTVGHALVPLIAKALGLPLYRHAITGTAVNLSKYYGAPAATADQIDGDDLDETEHLVSLLHQIKLAHPEANAVCSGAILSTYQRTRIESVAARMGLTSLSYLWQYPSLPIASPCSLLEDMARVGLDVRIIKVASGGLDESFLWSNLMDASVQKKISPAMSRFGGSALGEGGEYETIVVDGPPPLWAHRLRVDAKRLQTIRGEGGTAILSLSSNAVSLDAKSTNTQMTYWRDEMRQIPLWDLEFDILKSRGPGGGHHLSTHDYVDDQNERLWDIRPSESRLGSFHYIVNLMSEEVGDAKAQMADINATILRKLSELGRSTSDIVFTTIILRSITRDFSAVNQVYAQLFALPNPPARVTVASVLPDQIDVMVSIQIDLGERSQRDCLHVQSRSYWAPANVGPYSQAIKTPVGQGSVVHMAGQIPLVPATMEPLHPSFSISSDPMQTSDLVSFHENACLSLQHLWRVGRALNVSWWTGAVAFITGNSDIEAKARIAYRVWTQAHDPTLWTQETSDDESVDPWDRTHGTEKTWAVDPTCESRLPDYSRLVTGDEMSSVPGFLAVQVDELPRGIDVEWHSLGSSNNDVSFHPMIYQKAEAGRCSMGQSGSRTTFVYIPRKDEVASSLSDVIETLCDKDSTYESRSIVYTSLPLIAAGLESQIVPCRAVWGPQGIDIQRLAAGIVVHSEIGLKAS